MLKKILLLILTLAPAAMAMRGGGPKGGFRQGAEEAKKRLRRKYQEKFPEGAGQNEKSVHTSIVPTMSGNSKITLFNGDIENLHLAFDFSSTDPAVFFAKQIKAQLEGRQETAKRIAEILGIKPPVHLYNQSEALEKWNETHSKNLSENTSYEDYLPRTFYRDFHMMVTRGEKLKSAPFKMIRQEMNVSDGDPMVLALNALFKERQQYMKELAFQVRSIFEKKFEDIFKGIYSWESFSEVLSSVKEEKEAIFLSKIVLLSEGILKDISENDPHKKDKKEEREEYLDRMFQRSHEFFQGRAKKFFEFIQGLPEEDKRDILEKGKFNDAAENRFKFLFGGRKIFFSQNEEDLDELDSQRKEKPKKIALLMKALLENKQVKGLEKEAEELAQLLIKVVGSFQEKFLKDLVHYQDSDQKKINRDFYFSCFEETLENLREGMEGEVDQFMDNRSLAFQVDLDIPVATFKEALIQNISKVNWLGEREQKFSIDQTTLENLEKVFGVSPKKGLLSKQSGKIEEEKFEESKTDSSSLKGRGAPETDKESEMEALSKGFNHLNLDKKGPGKENLYEAG